MATRSAILYQGEDMSPALDYTDFVIWEESEFGTRAWRGEGSESTIVIRDPLGEQGSGQDLPSGLTAKSLASKNLFVIDLDGAYLFRGRIGIKNYGRDDQRVERYRQVEASLHDTNWDLGHIFVNAYSRPAETDNARIQGIIASYLSGSPRASTVLNGSNFLSGSNTVSLAAQTYNRTSPLAMLREISTTANKQFFVTGDTLLGGSLFWDGNDSTVYQAGIRISDRLDEMDTTTVCESGDSPGVLDSRGTFGSAGTGTMTVDVPSGTGGLIFAFGAHDGLTSVSARYDPNNLNPAQRQNMTLLGTVEHPTASNGSNTDNETVWVFWLQNPTPEIDNAEIDVFFSGTANGTCLGYWAVDSSAAPTLVGATGTGTSSSVNSGAGASDLVLDFVHWRIWSLGDASNDPSPTAGQTEDWGRAATQPAGQPDSAWGGGSLVGTGARTWSWTTSTNWVAGAIVVPADEAATVATFPPIWDVGPASTEDGSEQLCEVVLFYGTNADQYVTTHNLTVHNLYGHASQTFSDDADISAATALLRARAILAHRQYEDKTYNVTIGPLTDAQVLCVKHGQTIQIKARAIPDADDQFRTMRIVQCRYTTPIVGIWFAHLQLGRPWKLEPYGTGPTLVPTEAGQLTLADAGGYFTGTDTEAALQELAASDAAHIAAADPHNGYQKESEKGVADGYAELDGDGLVPLAQLPSSASGTGMLEVIFDGGSAVIGVGTQHDIIVPFDCTLTGWTILADQSGSIVIDVWRDTYANFAPTDADSLTASAPPTLTTATKAQDLALGDWTSVTLLEGDVLRLNVDSATTVERVTLALHYTKD